MLSSEPTTTNGEADPFAAERANIEATTPRTLDIVLEETIQGSNGKIYDHLHLQEPTVRQQVSAERTIKPGAITSLEDIRNYQIMLVSLVADVPRDVLDKMRIGQFEEAAAFFDRYGLIGRQIGRI